MPPKMKKQQEAQQKQKERHLKRKLKKERPLVNPDAGPDGLPANVLQNLVRAAQKHSVGNWQDFVKTAAPERKKSDPAAHTEEVLRAFVKHLLADAGPGAADTKGAIKPAAFVQHYVKWAHQVQKEQARKATSVAPLSIVKSLALAAPNATPSAPTSPQAAAADAAAAPKANPLLAGLGGVGSPEKLTSPWGLVHASRNHPKYRALYTLPSYLPGWARTKRHPIRDPMLECVRAKGKAGSSGAAKADAQEGVEEASGMRPRLLAMDCEMCETDREQAALVGLCVSDEKGDVLYKALVQPRGTIVNLRTELTGITAEDLETKPTVSRSQARKAVKGLVLKSWRERKQPTILVGHALHHDLMALRLDHQPVIDTSLIFSYRGLPACTPGLRDLSQAVLREDMPARGQGRHDSKEDAAVSMRLVMHELEQQHRTSPMAPPDIKVDKEQLCKLLVHSIPRNATEQEILGLFARKAAPASAAAAPRPCAAASGKAEGKSATAKESSGGGKDGSSSDESSSSGGSSGSGSESESNSSSESSSSEEEADEQPQRKKKKPMASPESGTSKQQAKPGGGAAKAGAGGASSSDSSSDDDSSESSSAEDAEEDGAKAAASGAKSSKEAGTQPPQPIGFEGNGIENRRAVLLFRTPADANAAFNSLAGSSGTDSNGRSSKEVPLQGDSARSVKVRRMAAHNGLLFQVPKQARRPRPQQVAAAELLLGGANGQPPTRRDKYRQRELLQKKGKTPQELLAAHAKYMRKKAKRAKKKERKAAAKEAKQAKQAGLGVAGGGVKVKRTRPFVKKTPAQKAAAAAAALAAGLPVAGGGGKQTKVTKKDLKKAAKRAAKEQRKLKTSTPKKAE